MELNCFRIRAANQKHILVLLPGERVADRITLFHEAPATNHRTLADESGPRESSVGAVRMSELFKRQTLDQLCDVPDEIIDVYVVERHIWQGGSVDDEAESKRQAAGRAPHRARLPDRPGTLAAQRRTAPACDALQPVRQDEPDRARVVGPGRVRLGQVAPALHSSVLSPWATRRSGTSFSTWRPRTRRASGNRSTTSTRTASPRSRAASRRGSSLP